MVVLRVGGRDVGILKVDRHSYNPILVLSSLSHERPRFFRVLGSTEDSW
jgi:hypothetical protein